MRPRRHLVVTVLSRSPSLFEIAVASEVFGLDRPELVDPWYEHRYAAATDRSSRHHPSVAKAMAGFEAATIERQSSVHRSS